MIANNVNCYLNCWQLFFQMNRTAWRQDKSVFSSQTLLHLTSKRMYWSCSLLFKTYCLPRCVSLHVCVCKWLPNKTGMVCVNCFKSWCSPSAWYYGCNVDFNTLSSNYSIHIAWLLLIYMHSSCTLMIIRPLSTYAPLTHNIYRAILCSKITNKLWLLAY